MLGAIIFVQQALEAGKRIFERFGWHTTHFQKGTETESVLPSLDFPMAHFEANNHAMTLGTFQNKVNKA